MPGMRRVSIILNPSPVRHDFSRIYLPSDDTHQITNDIKSQVIEPV